MNHLRSFLAVLRWDIVLELRRREAVLNMSLFAVLVLFIASYGLTGRTDAGEEFAPLVLWIAILFAGTVGLSRSFAVEKEAGAMTGVLLSPIDAGVFYLAKTAATWVYVMAMDAVVLAAYIVLFNYSSWGKVPVLLAVMAAFTLAYVAAGTVIAAMTASLRGGEVVLRVLLFPIMVPAIILALRAGDSIFRDGPAASDLGPALQSIGALLGLGAMYLSAGFLLFPKVIEE
jgi:heme exporter protein B